MLQYKIKIKKKKKKTYSLEPKKQNPQKKTPKQNKNTKLYRQKYQG